MQPYRQTETGSAGTNARVSVQVHDAILLPPPLGNGEHEAYKHAIN